MTSIYYMISPTGLGIRCDTEGQGYYRAKRGSRLHAGTDYICVPGQAIYSPVPGEIERAAYPYEKDLSYEGVLIVNPWITIKMFYFKPFKDLIGKEVKQGEHIGFAQDISARYTKKMTPHIHLEIVSIDPNIFIKK